MHQSVVYAGGGLALTILDAENGNAIPAAIAILSERTWFSPNYYSGFASVAGLAQIGDIEPGSYELRVHAADYSPHVRKLVLERTDLADTVRLERSDPYGLYRCDGCGLPPTLLMQVLDFGTGRPVPLASVSIPGSGLRAETDSHGLIHFKFENECTVSVHVRHAAYLDTTLFPVELSLGVPVNLSVGLLSRGGSNGCTFSGTVLRREDHIPLDGARITSPGTNLFTTTDSLGRFKFKGLQMESYPFIVSYGGRVPSVFSMSFSDSREVVDTVLILQVDTVSSGGAATGTTALAGSIIGPSGEPIRGARVRIPQLGLSTVSDSSGGFLFRDLEEGTYSLSVSAEGYRSVTTEKRELFAGEYDARTVRLKGVGMDKAVPSREAGGLEGMVVSSDEQRPVPGVSVSVNGVRQPAFTDNEGVFRFTSLREGVYSLLLRHSSYLEKQIDSVEVQNGNVSRIDIVLNRSSVTQLRRMHIRAPLVTDNAAALMKRRREDITVATAMGQEDMSKRGAGNAADAMKYMPGVTVVDGKYVFIRGLGDRYAKTLMNGMELPSADPDRNAVAFDLFPTGLLDNIVVRKSFAPDMSAQFSGGTVDIKTRAIPDKPTWKVSASLGLNTESALRDDFLAAEDGKYDWFAIDDGTRALPEGLVGDTVWFPGYMETLFAPEESLEVHHSRHNELANAFDTPFEADREHTRPDQSYSTMLGNQIDLPIGTCGLSGSFTYKNKQRVRADYIATAEWTQDSHDDDSDSLVLVRELKGDKGTEEVMWGALINVAYEPVRDHFLDGVFFRTQSAEKEAKTARQTVWEKEVLEDYWYDHFKITYRERSLSFGVLSGEHLFPLLDGLTLDWKLLRSETGQQEPDMREVTVKHRIEIAGSERDTVAEWPGNLGKAPSHRYRFSTENARGIRLDVRLESLLWDKNELAFKFGGERFRKNRDFEQHWFKIDVARRGASRTIGELSGDVNAFVDSDNLGMIPVDTVDGVVKYKLGNVLRYLDQSKDIEASHAAELVISGIYGLAEVPLPGPFTLVGGVRREWVDQTVQSKDTAIHNDFVYVDWFPSAFLMIEPHHRLKFRLGWSKTYGIPLMREIAPYEATSPGTKRREAGNPALSFTRIHNADLSVEWYISPGEWLVFGAFGKYLEKPIQVVSIDTENEVYTWNHVDEARIGGLELEFRKNLGFMHPSLEQLALGGNATAMHSETDIDSARVAALRVVKDKPEEVRPLWGAAPYTLNLYCEYSHDPTGLAASIQFHCVGNYLDVAEGSTIPDRYVPPNTDLGFTLSKRLFRGLAVELEGGNLLNGEKAVGQYFKDQFFPGEHYPEGRTWSLKLSYAF